MAATVSNNGLEDIASSLSTDDVVPQKMRCAICDHLAFNAFKLPCCDQNICADCQSTLPQACPVCQHSPLSANDTKASKALRLTVGQFLKGVKKRRDKNQASLALGEVAAAFSAEVANSGAQQASTNSVATTVTDNELAPGNAHGDLQHTLQDEQHIAGQLAAFDEMLDEPSVENGIAKLYIKASTTLAHLDEQTEQVKEDTLSDEEFEDGESDASDIQIVTGDEEAKAIDQGVWEQDQSNHDAQWMSQNQYGHQQMDGQDFAFSGDFSQMGFTPEMMQMMMQMGGGGWPNMTNMMGMPGMAMGMNHVDMSAMFGQLGMQGMGNLNSNMMNMNVMNGIADINFSGNFGNWNAQQQMSGDYGTSSGFYPSSGYNQSHHADFPHMSHHHQSSKHNFHNTSSRGSQRGFGRGYHNQGFHGRFQGQNMPAGDRPPPGAPTGPRAHHRGTTDGNNQQLHNPKLQRMRSSGALSIQQLTSIPKSSTPGSTDPHRTNARSAAQVGELERETEANKGDAMKPAAQGYSDTSHISGAREADTSWTTPGEPFDSHKQADECAHNGTNRPHQPADLSSTGKQGSDKIKHSFNGQGSDTAPPELHAQPSGKGVEGAPTGPKALREGATRIGGRRGSLVGHIDLTPGFTSRGDAALPSTSVRGRSSSCSGNRTRHRRSQSPDSGTSYDRERDQKRRRVSHRADRLGTVESEDGPTKEQRSQSVELSFRELRRHSQDRVRSTKEHRHSSKERHRHRHRHRSRSPDRSGSHHRRHNAALIQDSKPREDVRRRDRDKYRNSSRERERRHERSRSHGRDRDRDHHKQRSSRRNRSASEASDHHNHPKNSGDKTNRNVVVQERVNRYGPRDQPSAVKSVVPQMPSLQKQLQAASRKEGFQIQGRHKAKLDAAAAIAAVQDPAIAPPDDGRTKMQPPSGPRLDRGTTAPKSKLDVDGTTIASSEGVWHTSLSSSRRASQTATPTSANAPAKGPPSPDPYEEERRRAQEARIAKELSRRKGGDVSSGSAVAKKRANADEDVPTGPRDRKSKKSRSSAYRYGDDRDLSRVEDERESVRYR